MATTTRRQFTDAFKFEAVRLTRESGRPVAQVARELGISDNVLYRWRSEQPQVDSQGRTRQAVRAEQDELTRCSIIGSAVTRPSAMTPRPSTKRGRQLLNQVSTELGEDHS